MRNFVLILVVFLLQGRLKMHAHALLWLEAPMFKHLSQGLCRRNQRRLVNTDRERHKAADACLVPAGVFDVDLKLKFYAEQFADQGGAHLVRVVLVRQLLRELWCHLLVNAVLPLE